MTTESLLVKAVKEINEKDAEGAVGEIKTLIKLITSNDKTIAKYMKSNEELKSKITKLVSVGGLSAQSFTA